MHIQYKVTYKNGSFDVLNSEEIKDINEINNQCEAARKYVEENIHGCVNSDSPTVFNFITNTGSITILLDDFCSFKVSVVV